MSDEKEKDYYIDVRVSPYHGNLRQITNCFSFEQADEISQKLYAEIHSTPPKKKEKIVLYRHWYKRTPRIYDFVDTISTWNQCGLVGYALLETEILSEKEF